MQQVTGGLVSEEELRRIICEPLAGDLLVKVADKLGDQLSTTLKASQIRAIFDEAQRIGSLFRTGKFEEAVRRAHLLDPKISYRAKRVAERDRKAGSAAELIADVLKKALRIVLERTDDRDEVRARYVRFLEFFEAVVAYHKAHGGKD